MEDDDRAKYLFLSLLQARVGSSLVAHLGNLATEAVLRTPLVELAGRAKISEGASRAFEELQSVFDPGRMQERLAAKGIEVLTPVDETYPGPLRSIPDPPPAVFVNGAVPDTVSVALVGSRKASATGIETARALGLALSERGVCVVSGLALGVDAAAHEGAVEAGGPTVGVLGCGIDVTYPTKYKQLRATFPRPALPGAHATIRSNECLAMGHRLPDRFIGNVESDTQNQSVCMRWDVSFFCSARCCGRSEGSEATGAGLRWAGVKDMHHPGYVLRRIPLPRTTTVNNVSTLWEKRGHGMI